MENVTDREIMLVNMPREVADVVAQAATLEPVSAGWTDDLLAEIDAAPIRYRVWRSRLTVEDGASCDNEVTVEQYTPTYGWRTVLALDPKEIAS